ncbi:MAG: hypothetical protein JSU70_12035 [Phycisphaerales bacterium]|nr:MAG: hypothetical protein JSU70_12035 [Phycisphaerales bacterium]
MRRSIFIVAITGVVVLTARPAVSGPLLKSRVGKDANWVVHLDCEQLKRAQIGGLIREELVRIGVEEKLANFAEVFSFHPLDDLQSVTLYGNGPDEERAVVLAEGRFDAEKLLAIVRLNPRYEEIKHGDFVLHGWLQEDKHKDDQTTEKMVYGCLYDKRLVVMSAGLDAVKWALDVLAGTAEDAADGVFDQAALSAEGAFFQVAANGVGEMADEEEAAVLKQTDALGLAVGEVEGDFYADLELTADTSEVAQGISKILEGVIAFVSLSGEDRPRLAELAKKVELSCQGNSVRVHLGCDPRAVFELLREQWEKDREKKNGIQ